MLTTPKLNPKKTCQSLLLELLWHLLSKLHGLVIRCQVSTKGIKMQFVGVVVSKSSTLTVYRLSSWFVPSKLKTYSSLCVPYRLSHLSWFHEIKHISPAFFVLDSQIMIISPKTLKIWFLRSLLFDTSFSWCWKN